MKSIATGVFEGGLPWGFIGIGIGVAIVIIAADCYLVAIGSTFRMPVLAVAIGIYLPFQLSVPIFAGGVIHEIVRRIREKRANTSRDMSHNSGLLFASGLITGEALAGILIAIPIVLTGDKHFLSVLKNPLGTWPAWILLVVIVGWLYRVAIKRKTN